MPGSKLYTATTDLFLLHGVVSETGFRPWLNGIWRDRLGNPIPEKRSTVHVANHPRRIYPRATRAQPPPRRQAGSRGNAPKGQHVSISS